MQMSGLGQALRRTMHELQALSVRMPWLGWAAWWIFILIALLRTNPRRLAASYEYYMEALSASWAHQPVYDLSTLGAFLYWPPTLVLYSPLLSLNPVTSAVIVEIISALLMSWGSITLMRELLRRVPNAQDPIVLAGFLLAINILGAWFNIKSVQAQIPMTGAMMIAAAAMMRARWNLAAFWLFVAAVIKPLAIVMILLCGAVERRMRWQLMLAIVFALLMPFVVYRDFAYVIELYRTWSLKMWIIGNVLPGEWPYQADFSIMLASFGIIVPRAVATAIRAAAALGTLWLAVSIARPKSNAALGFGVLLLTGCYICLFGTRTEFLSFFVLTPPLTALALLLLARNVEDTRAWLLILAALALGFDWPYGVTIDGVLKPAIVTVIYGWLVWLSVVPERWRALVEDGTSARAAAQPVG